MVKPTPKSCLKWLGFITFIIILTIFKSKRNRVAQITPTLNPSPSSLSIFTPSPSPSPIINQTIINSSGVNTPETSENISKIYPANAGPSPQPSFSPEEIHGFIDEFSQKYNLDSNLLRHIAVCESGFNPSAKNLSYAGLFQFSPNAWAHYQNLLNLEPDPDTRYNAKISVQTASYVLSINQAYIWPNCIPD